MWESNKIESKNGGRAIRWWVQESKYSSPQIVTYKWAVAKIPAYSPHRKLKNHFNASSLQDCGILGWINKKSQTKRINPQESIVISKVIQYTRLQVQQPWGDGTGGIDNSFESISNNFKQSEKIKI